MRENFEDNTTQLGPQLLKWNVLREPIPRGSWPRFSITEIGSFGIDPFKDLTRADKLTIESFQPKACGGELGMPPKVSVQQKYRQYIVIAPNVILGAPKQNVVQSEASFAELPIDISPAAQERISGNKSLVATVFGVIKEEVKHAAVLPTITVRPAWSHEYEDLTGIVIEVEIEGDTEKRFTLWEAISSKLDALLDTISSEEQSFLTDNITVIVNQSE
jgi:hypothetical protein